MKKILHVVTSVDPASGGVAESILSHSVQLVEMGHSIEVVSMGEANAPFVAGYELKLHPPGRGYTKLQYHPRLRRWPHANCRRFDAVVVAGLWEYHGIATRNALKGMAVPYFVFSQGMLDPLFKSTYPVKHRKNWLFWPWAEYRVLRDAKGVLFTCEEEQWLAPRSFWLYQANELIAAFGTAEPPSNASALGNNFLANFPQVHTSKYLLFLCRIHTKKGCDLLLDAFAASAKHYPCRQLVKAGPSKETLINSVRFLRV